MEEISVNDYVRTKNKGICKIHHINEKATVNKYWVNPDYDDWCTVVKTTEIVKYSPNIIDLIEVGDYVNGHKIEEKFYDYANKEYHLVTEGKKHIFVKDIKSIVTKEMMKNVMYEV